MVRNHSHRGDVSELQPSLSQHLQGEPLPRIPDVLGCFNTFGGFLPVLFCSTHQAIQTAVAPHRDEQFMELGIVPG